MGSYINLLKGSISNMWMILEDMLIVPLFPPTLSRSSEHVDLRGKRVLVTGSNSGVGRELALYFAKQGAEVFMLCRSGAPHETPAAEVTETIKAQTGNASVHLELIEMSSLESIRSFVERWAARSPEDRRIDILMNNAGIFPGHKNTTEDGFEATYQINFLSQFLLTTSLLRLSCFAQDARILQTNSNTSFQLEAPLVPGDPNSSDKLSKCHEGGYLEMSSAAEVYARSKASQLVWVLELQDRLSKTEHWKDVTVQCHYPGVVASGLFKDPNGMAGHAAASKFHAFVQTRIIPKIGVFPAQGALMAVYLATAPEAARPDLRGKFWAHGRWMWTPAWMADTQLRGALWKRWEEDAGVEAAF